MVIAFIGDVVGRSGRRAVAKTLPKLKSDYQVDLVIANLENAAGGIGITAKALGELESAGVEFFTSGNHVWDKKEGVRLLNERANILRPANYPSANYGRGHRVLDISGIPVAVFNIQGRVFMPAIDCPFRVIDRLLLELGDRAAIKIVDFHAEATSEKRAMGWYLDGRVSAVLGTHTHIPTRDAEIFPNGTGYVTDVGMTGAYDSVLGVSKETAIQRFLEMRPIRFEVARNDLRSDVVVLEIDEGTGKTRRIEHLQFKVEE